ncbi:MAG TPA: hypothetical protein VFT90_06190 [Chryseosolibacter sp.]|nr:hypothetical protein [Chryseosolibacter sp.]
MPGLLHRANLPAQHKAVRHDSRLTPHEGSRTESDEAQKRSSRTPSLTPHDSQLTTHEAVARKKIRRRKRSSRTPQLTTHNSPLTTHYFNFTA